MRCEEFRWRACALRAASQAGRGGIIRARVASRGLVARAAGRDRVRAVQARAGYPGKGSYGASISRRDARNSSPEEVQNLYGQ